MNRVYLNIKLFLFLAIVAGVGFLATQKTQAIEDDTMSVQPQTFPVGTASVLVTGNFFTESLEAACNTPNNDQVIEGYYPRSIVNGTFRYDITDTNGNIVQAGNFLNASNYELYDDGVQIDCGSVIPVPPGAPKRYTFTNLFIDVSGLPAGDYHIAFSSEETADGACFDTDDTNCARITEAPLQTVNEDLTPSISITVTTTSTVRVQSNLDTCWDVDGPTNLTAHCGVSDVDSANPGVYSITADDLWDADCDQFYDKNINANPQTLNSGAEITFIIEYTSNCPPECTFEVSPTSTLVGSGGGSGSFNVIASDPSCEWDANSNDAWIIITSGSSGTGNGTVNFTVLSNSGSARTGTISVEDQTFTIDQDGAPGCSYSINPTSANYPYTGGSDTVNVTTAAGCNWVTSENLSWVTITSGNSGTGNGVVGYTVDPNSGSARNGTMTLAGETFTINQAAAPGCSYSINPPSASYPYTGGNGTITVTTSPGCTWTSSENLSWVSLNAPTSGTGSGTLSYSVSSNSGTARSGIIVVAGINFTVNQEAFGGGGNVLSFTITYTPKTLNTPTNVSVDHTCVGLSSRMDITWNYVGIGTEDGFNVYRSTDGVNWGSAIAFVVVKTPITNSYSYQDTPPATGVTYHYMVRAVSDATESANSNIDSAMNVGCIGILTGQKTLLQVNGVNFNPATTTIKQGDTLTWRITFNNGGPSNVTVNFICEDPSSNLTNMANLSVSGSGAVGSGIVQSDGTCIGLDHSGKRLNVSGTMGVVGWTVTFNTTFTSSGTEGTEEPIENSATIYYTDGTGQHPLTVRASTVLVGSEGAKVPTFREVAP